MKFSVREVCPYGFAVAGVALVVLAVLNFNSCSRIDRLENDNLKLREQLVQTSPAELFSSRIERLESDNLKLREQLVQTSPAELFSWDIEAMKKKGLADPANDVVSDLIQHRDLIPHAGSVGGTMSFFDKSKIWVLTGKWVFAYFEDGHNGGYALLEYEVRDGGEIIWKTVASYVT